MNEKVLYAIQGSYTYPDLPIDSLIDINELIYFNEIRPLNSNKNLPMFNAKNIEEIVIKLYQEILKAKKFINKKQSFQLNKFPYLNQKLEFYLINNPKLAKNTIFKLFIEEEYHLNVFVLSLFNETEYKDQLDQLFREFYFEYRFIAYISQLLYFEAINFDKKRRKQYDKESLILEQPVKYGEDTKLLDKILIQENDEFEITTDSFDEYLTNEQLFKSFKNLTNRQQTILYLAYVKKYKDIEIAKKLNISQQAVSKNRKNALLSLRKAMEV